MKRHALLFAACLLLWGAIPSFADEASVTVRVSVGRPDGHAPIGVMHDHIHAAGKVMLSYRYMRMEMDGSKDGTDNLSTAEVLARFPVAPLNMTMEMHMFGAMYAPTDWATLMFMAPLLSNEMEHVTRTGVHFTTESDGIGDVGLFGIFQVWDDALHDLHLVAGLTFPSGSIDERDHTPAQANALLPYPMQLGSGTVDVRPGITYRAFLADWSWGGQFLATIRLGENEEDYTLGDRFALTAWGAVRLSDWLSTSLRFAGLTWGDIDGRDIRLDPNQVQTANPDLQAGTRVDLNFGVNVLFPRSTGVLAGNRIAIELGLPFYQKLDGPQLETDWLLTVGWQKAF